MAIKTPEKLITKSHGKSNRVPCPSCKKEVCFSLFENVDLSPVAALLKKQGGFFAVCPECAAVFSVNENYIREKESGTVCAMTQSDLSKWVNK